MINPQDLVNHIIEKAETISENTPTEELVRMLLMAMSLLDIHLPPPENMEKETVAVWLENGLNIVKNSTNPMVQEIFK